MSQSPRLYRSPSEGPGQRHLGRNREARESARGQILMSATAPMGAASGCRALTTCPDTRQLCATEHCANLHAATAQPFLCAKMKSIATSESTAQTGVGNITAGAVPRRARYTTVQRAVEGTWGAWEMAYSADRAEGAYRSLSFSLRSLFCFAAHAIDAFAFPFLTTLVVIAIVSPFGSMRI